MPLPLLPLAAGAVALLALAKKGSPPPSSSVPASGGLAPPNKQSTPLDAGVDPSKILAGAGQIGGAIAAGIAAATGGVALDKAINPNSSVVSQTAAGIAVGGTAVLVVLAVFGVLGITFPIVGIFVAVAVAIYFIIFFAQDLARLAYGQAGARKDFTKQFSDVYKSAVDQVQARSQAGLSGLELERQAQPFTEGFMERLNWATYQSVLFKKNVVVSGAISDLPDGPLSSKSGFPLFLHDKPCPGTTTPLTTDLLWHINWYLDRGYMLGDSPTMRAYDNPPEFVKDPQFGNFPWQKSLDNDWILAHAPPADVFATKQDTLLDALGVTINLSPTPTFTPPAPDPALSTPAGVIALAQQVLAQSVPPPFTPEQATAAFLNVIFLGAILFPNHRTFSPDNRFNLVFQGDGNLVLYGPSGALWATGTNGGNVFTKGASCQFQNDGNLVVYNLYNKALWASHTSGVGGKVLTVQSDGNVVILDAAGKPIWDTGTAGRT